MRQLGPGARIVGLRRGNESAKLDIEDMHLTVFDHVVPAVQDLRTGFLGLARRR